MIRTQRGKGIIQKAEKQLLNERIKNINYTLELYEHDKHMYKNELEELLKQDQEIWRACLEEIEKRKELRHRRVMERHIRKFNKLLKSWEEQDQKQGGCSNHQRDHSKEQGPDSKDRAKKWVINLSSIPLRTKRVSWHMVQML